MTLRVTKCSPCAVYRSPGVSHSFGSREGGHDRCWQPRTRTLHRHECLRRFQTGFRERHADRDVGSEVGRPGHPRLVQGRVRRVRRGIGRQDHFGRTHQQRGLAGRDNHGDAQMGQEGLRLDRPGNDRGLREDRLTNHEPQPGAHAGAAHGDGHVQLRRTGRRHRQGSRSATAAWCPRTGRRAAAGATVEARDGAMTTALATTTLIGRAPEAAVRAQVMTAWAPMAGATVTTAPRRAPSSATRSSTAVTPEAPMALLFPVAGLLIGGAAYAIARRRRAATALHHAGGLSLSLRSGRHAAARGSSGPSRPR